MSRRIPILPVLAALLAMPLAVFAEDLSARARLDPSASSLREDGAGLALKLSLSQPVPWRAFTLADPPRLVIDFREVDWRGTDLASILASTALAGSEAPSAALPDMAPETTLATTRVTGLRAGALRPGWSRLVLDLSGPFALASAEMATGSGALLRVRLEPAGETAFRAASGAPADAGWSAVPLPEPAPDQASPGPADGRLTVMLDPGHGGIDPGAEGAGTSEAALMLSFARALRDALRRAGYRVVLTRSDDVFVPLETRITAARAAGADLFLSLHADAVAEGSATGATVYTLSDTASDEASAALAERHDRADLLAGVDLSGKDDEIAGVLMGIARLDTRPRSAALADAIVAGLRASVGGLHKRPRLEAGFSVLRAPDMPSVLIELGFISSPRDLGRLTSAEWRANAAQGILAGIAAWEAADAARMALVRR